MRLYGANQLAESHDEAEQLRIKRSATSHSLTNTSAKLAKVQKQLADLQEVVGTEEGIAERAAAERAALVAQAQVSLPPQG